MLVWFVYVVSVILAKFAPLRLRSRHCPTSKYRSHNYYGPTDRCNSIASSAQLPIANSTALVGARATQTYTCRASRAQQLASAHAHSCGRLQARKLCACARAQIERRMAASCATSIAVPHSERRANVPKLIATFRPALRPRAGRACFRGVGRNRHL